MEYCCHVWSGAPSCYLESLDKLQKQICRTVGPSLVACLEPWAYRRNVASLSPFYVGIALVDVHMNWFNWFHSLFLEGGLLFILIDCTIFLSPFLDVTRMSMSTVSFLTQLGSGILCLWNAFLCPTILLALTLELTNTFNCRFFLNRFPVWFNLFVLLFLVTLA